MENKIKALKSEEKDSLIDFLQQKISMLESKLYEQRESHINECLMCEKIDFHTRIYELESLLSNCKNELKYFVDNIPKGVKINNEHSMRIASLIEEIDKLKE